MTIFFAILALLGGGFAIFVLMKNKKLEADLLRVQSEAQASVAAMQQESQSSVAEAQKLIDQQFVEMQQEAERIRKHYEAESRKIQEAADALVSKTIKDFEPLRKYEKLRDAEAEAHRQLADALKEATSLQAEAQSLLEQARNSAAAERSQAIQRAKEIREQANALLNQTTREAGRIVEAANKRAEQIGGDAYIALRDKQTLDQAVKALWNVVEGYGDRYIIPTRSLLDELAADFGHTEAGEALKVAREQSRRMVEQREAAACNYVETDRRDRANRFVVDAFNGRVDAILSRTKHDNFGTLEQEIRDAFGLVNLNGLAFRDARILPVYLDSRLAELKLAVVVQELKLRAREEQRRIQEQMREDEKVRREQERAIKDAQEKEEAIKSALEKARQEAEHSSAQERAKFDARIAELSQRLAEAEAVKQREISMAQLTRAGNVYIISNIGSFGKEVFKIGMTRRREPMDRIWELGDASVPFEFDVHAMIYSEDAPALERMLHDAFDDLRINKVNYRKEFFRLPLERIKSLVADKGLNAAFTLVAEAHEYRETKALEKMTPEEREKYHLRRANGEDLVAE
ncbi:MAG: DUF4041 domain-containing protein [Verrucomicrobia subdivision 3 bacterium]|nr:DUF4041 domain-containing protein [Limisphaerales bacterium]